MIKFSVIEIQNVKHLCFNHYINSASKQFWNATYEYQIQFETLGKYGNFEKLYQNCSMTDKYLDSLNLEPYSREVVNFLFLSYVKKDLL